MRNQFIKAIGRNPLPPVIEGYRHDIICTPGRKGTADTKLSVRERATGAEFELDQRDVAAWVAAKLHVESANNDPEKGFQGGQKYIDYIDDVMEFGEPCASAKHRIPHHRRVNTQKRSIHA